MNKHKWLVVILGLVGLWVILGVYFAREDSDFIWSLGSYSHLAHYDQEMYLYGSDYMAYDWLRQESSPSARILALIPDPYFYTKMHYFLYPRTIRAVGDPEALAADLKAHPADYLMTYLPPDERLWGAIVAFEYIKKYQWSEDKVYRGVLAALGQDKVGTEGAFLAKAAEFYGNIVYEVGGSP